jgi:hypothetical protein
MERPRRRAKAYSLNRNTTLGIGHSLMPLVLSAWVHMYLPRPPPPAYRITRRRPRVPPMYYVNKSSRWGVGIGHESGVTVGSELTACQSREHRLQLIPWRPIPPRPNVRFPVGPTGNRTDRLPPFRDIPVVTVEDRVGQRFQHVHAPGARLSKKACIGSSSRTGRFLRKVPHRIKARGRCKPPRIGEMTESHLKPPRGIVVICGDCFKYRFDEMILV